MEDPEELGGPAEDAGASPSFPQPAPLSAMELQILRFLAEADPGANWSSLSQAAASSWSGYMSQLRLRKALDDAYRAAFDRGVERAREAALAAEADDVWEQFKASQPTVREAHKRAQVAILGAIERMATTAVSAEELVHLSNAYMNMPAPAEDDLDDEDPVTTGDA